MTDRDSNGAREAAAGSRSDDVPAPTDEALPPTEAFDFDEPSEPPDGRPPVDAAAEPEAGAPPLTETTAPNEQLETYQPFARESMTDQESGRAEAEASAEAAIDDGRGTALPGDEDRDPTLDLAALHLRLGSLALARSELETFAGRGALDASARIDLAEVRWRTGDLVGGGEAAREALAGGGEAVVALVVAAEAASALGRPSEARRLAGRAMSLHGGPVDAIFAGMPRSSVWPADPAEPLPTPSTLFPPERSDLAIESERDDATLGAGDDRDGVVATETTGATAASADPGLWDLHEAAAIAAAAAQPVPTDLDPSALFDAGRAALENGDRPSAAVHLGLVVRMAPALAPAVLSLIGDPDDSGLQLVQGDAYRAVGHEAEARRSYAAAIASASTPSTPSSVEWFGPPSTAEPRAAAWWLESLDESRPAAAWPPAAPAAPPVEPRGPEPDQPEADGTVTEPAEPEPEPDQPAADATIAEPAEPVEPVEPVEPGATTAALVDEAPVAEPDQPGADATIAEPVEPAEPAEPAGPDHPEADATIVEPAEPEADAETAERGEPGADATTAEPTGAEAEPQAAEPEADATTAEPTGAEPEPGWRDDEGGWRVEDEEWRSDG